MHPQRTLIESAHQIALDEIALMSNDTPESYDHKSHIRDYEKAIASLPNDDSDKTLRAKDAALKQHHPMKFHALEAAESIESAHKQGQKVNLGEIMEFHFTTGYIPSMKRHHGDRYPKLMNAHKESIYAHEAQFEDHVGALLETHYNIKIDENGNTQDIG